MLLKLDNLSSHSQSHQQGCAWLHITITPVLDMLCKLEDLSSHSQSHQEGCVWLHSYNTSVEHTVWALEPEFTSPEPIVPVLGEGRDRRFAMAFWHRLRSTVSDRPCLKAIRSGRVWWSRTSYPGLWVHSHLYICIHKTKQNKIKGYIGWRYSSVV